MQTQVADFDVNDFNQGGTSEADKALLVKFFIKPRQDASASRKEGRPIFKDVEYVDIKIPGDRNGGACRPATDQDKKRFPEHYRRFKDRTEDDFQVGTPLSEWPLVSRSLCEELAFYNVKTVEQLANMADTQVGSFMGLYQIREKAKVWLKNAEDEKPLWEMQQKLEAQSQEIDELKAMVSDLLKVAEGAESDDDELNPRQRQRKRARTVKHAKDKVV